MPRRLAQRRKLTARGGIVGAREILVRLNGAQGVCGTRWRELHSFWVRMRVGHQPAVRPAPGAGPCLSQAREARKETWGREACIYERHAVLKESSLSFFFRRGCSVSSAHRCLAASSLGYRGPACYWLVHAHAHVTCTCACIYACAKHGSNKRLT